ncbi:RNA polymerase sigma-70 factor [Flavitalea sp. BT771]|uniref:RNA polymerase sigma-70 factor n=1 Tax=Flavitalea sp. BT771 TaxID=3063329 RepID=UPI0026E35E55|nr:RNA polymerase sigma-70 factor [Flavitalea sp. BT771]MDO6432878.1 RNA polymerase sigma-70 factor [Flavitalea sp. BT771]MDV6221846.1 RNA polymerase sigma-70 factor [Flavitalea sp. BT771]
MQDEAILWERIRLRDELAFEAYYKEHHQAFYLMACRYLHDPASAREVVNDVFMNLWQKADSIRIETSLKAYIYRAVINRCINVLNKRKRDAAQMKAVREHQAVTEEHRLMEDNEMWLLICEAIDGLPEQCRNVFRMSRFQKMKQQEIADRLGISIKTVKYHITQALKQLYHVLVSHDMLGLLLLHGFIFHLAPRLSSFLIV